MPPMRIVCGHRTKASLRGPLVPNSRCVGWRHGDRARSADDPFLTIPLRTDQQDGNVEPQSSLRGKVASVPASSLRLGVSGIRLTGHHGVHSEERKHGNRFEVDVEVGCSSVDAVETDELADTIDYQEITDLVREVSRRQPFNLIESLAGAIADALLAKYATISDAVVRVSKLVPPGLSDVARTVAEVTRSRG